MHGKHYKKCLFKMNKYPKESIVAYCAEACKALERSSNFAQTYVDLKQDFFNKFQAPYVFSTTFGAAFFEEIHFRLQHNKPLTKEELGVKQLGEYDKNFNIWLTNIV